jgi:hypothetical protein
MNVVKFVMSMDRNFIHVSEGWVEEQDGAKKMIMMIIVEEIAAAVAGEAEEHHSAAEVAEEDLTKEVRHLVAEEAAAPAEEVLDLCLVKK